MSDGVVGDPAAESWCSLRPQEASTLLSAVGTLWWVAGGWALDLYLGKVTRDHKDLDIGISRKDAARVVTALPGWEFFEARGGVLAALAAGLAPRAEVNSLWCKRANAAQWELELMLDDVDGEFWIFRRDARITRPLSSAIRRSPEGIAYLAPEIQLLYKACAIRAQDQADFDHVAPYLARDARTWLRDSLRQLDPGHVWLATLNQSIELRTDTPLPP